MTLITPEKMIVDKFNDAFGATESHWISEPGGLTQFGAFVEVLGPGGRSSIKHWHSDEDEMVYVLDGEVTLHEGSADYTLRRGDAATFKAGDPVGHCFENLGTAPVKYLVIGTRAASDTCTYPDHNRKALRTGGENLWTDMDGNPASNPYKDSKD